MSATEEIPTYVWTDPGQLGAYLTMKVLSSSCWSTGSPDASASPPTTTTIPPGSDPRPIPQGMGFSGHKNLNFNRPCSENN